jgi:hypothetical protein
MVKVADMTLRLACCVALAALGCRKSSDGLTAPTIAELATNIVRLAQTQGTALESVMEDSQREQLLEMIRRSGMLTNYATRLQESQDEAQLDYHELTRNLHFQIDLKRDGRMWKVDRIWVCR